MSVTVPYALISLEGYLIIFLMVYLISITLSNGITFVMQASEIIAILISCTNSLAFSLPRWGHPRFFSFLGTIFHGFDLEFT
jgi:hypothetical protein